MKTRAAVPVVGIVILALCSSLGTASDLEIHALNASAPLLLAGFCLPDDGSNGAGCGVLNRGPGTFTNCNSRNHMDCCQHVCRQGYIQSGDGEAQCINGNWTGDNSFQCNLNSTWCGGPTLENAASTVCDKNTPREHLTLCRFECLPGYVASTSGAIERQCKGGDWVGSEEPHCVAEPSDGPLTIGVLILVVLMGAFVLLGGFTCMKMRSQAQVPQGMNQSKVVSGGGGGRTMDVEAQPMSSPGAVRGGTYSRAQGGGGGEGATDGGGGPGSPIGTTRRAPSRRVLRSNDESLDDGDDNSELDMSDDDVRAGGGAAAVSSPRGGGRRKRKKAKGRHDDDDDASDDDDGASRRERRKKRKDKGKDKDKKDSKRKKKDRRGGGKSRKDRKDRDDDAADDQHDDADGGGGSSDDGLDKEARRRRRKEKRDARKRKHRKKKDRSSRVSDSDGGDDAHATQGGEGHVGHTGGNAAPIPEAAPDAPLPAAAAAAAVAPVPPAYSPPPPAHMPPAVPAPAAAEEPESESDDEPVGAPAAVVPGAAAPVVGPDGHVMVPAPPGRQIRQLKLKKKEVKQPKVLKLGSRKPQQPPAGLSLASGAHPAAVPGAAPSSPPPGVPAGLQLAPAPGAAGPPVPPPQ